MRGIELAYMNDQNADLEGAIAQNAEEVWAQLQDPKTYVYVSGPKQISALLDEAMAKIVESPEAYEQQKAKMIDEGRWAELIC